MADNTFNDLEPGEDVTFITAGSFQLVDVARDIVIPALREVTAPLSPFILDHLRNGNLRLVGSEGAPEATGDPVNGEEELKQRLRAGRVQDSVEAGVPAPREPSDNPDNTDDQASATGNEALTSSTTGRRGRAKTDSE